MKYLVQYTLPYEHRVMVGIEEESPEAAIAKAERLFDQGEIWDDSPEVPLLSDDFDEVGDAGVPLNFTVKGEVTGDWPEPDASVMDIRRREAAFEAARLLVEAYDRGEERGGSVDWEDLDQAYQVALNASATSPAERAYAASGGARKRVTVVAPAVAVLDYDTDELRHITQSDDSKAEAVEPAGIDLDAVFQDIET